MIPIRKGPPPKEFLEWRRKAGPSATFNDVPGDIKKRVRESLCEEQGYLCAYCMRRISDSVRGAADMDTKIEHIEPQHPEEGPANERSALDYRRNLVAVCSGVHLPEERGRIRTCDTSKGNTPISLNPLDAITITGELGVKYRLSQGVIYSEDQAKNLDLDTVLNLNGKLAQDEDLRVTLQKSPLVRARRAVWERAHGLAQKDLEGKGDAAALRYFEDKQRHFENANPKPEYVGVVMYYLQREIRRLKRRLG